MRDGYLAVARVSDRGLKMPHTVATPSDEQLDSEASFYASSSVKLAQGMSLEYADRFRGAEVFSE